MSLIKRALFIFFWITMMARPVYSDGLRQSCGQHDLSKVFSRADSALTGGTGAEFSSEPITTGGIRYALYRTTGIIDDP